MYAAPKIKNGNSNLKIDHNALTGDDLVDIQEKDRYYVVLANPPFGGKERAEVQQNFPVKKAKQLHYFCNTLLKY